MRFAYAAHAVAIGVLRAVDGRRVLAVHIDHRSAAAHRVLGAWMALDQDASERAPERLCAGRLGLPTGRAAAGEEENESERKQQRAIHSARILKSARIVRGDAGVSRFHSSLGGLLALLTLAPGCGAEPARAAPASRPASPTVPATTTPSPAAETTAPAEPPPTACEFTAQRLESEVDAARRCKSDSDCDEVPLGGCFDLCGPPLLNPRLVSRTLAERVTDHTARCGLLCGVPKCAQRSAMRIACRDSRCQLARKTP